MSNSDAEEEDIFFAKLCSHVKLERDNAFQEFAQMKLSSDQIRNYENKFLLVLQTDESPWEAKQSCLISFNAIIELTTVESYEKLKPICSRLLHDDEVRVRLATGELLGSLCKRFGTIVYEYFHELVLNSIRINLERSSILNANESKELLEKLAAFHNQTVTEEDMNNATKVFHDTAGWHHLETSLKALHFMIEGCGIKFLTYIDAGLIELIFKIIIHTNRFVREIGFLMLASILESFNPIRETGSKMEPNYPEFINADKLAVSLCVGLTDSWSQVRLAACVATRQFLTSFDCIQKREVYFPQLLAPLCLNRYHLAEGLRLYAQTTWALIVGDQGRFFVEKYIDNVARYYADQTKSANYTVRISSCQCIAELASKMNKDILKPHAAFLLETLMSLLNDKSWQVRDAACLGCEKIVTSFPDESKDYVEKLLPIIFSNLSDAVPTVCSGAAESLSKIVEVYGVEIFAIVFTWIKNGLKKVDEEKPSTSKKSDETPLPLNAARIVVAQNSISVVKTVPQIKEKEKICICTVSTRVAHEGPCIFHRVPSPWEVTDGCVQLVAELSATKNIQMQMKIASEILPLLVSASMNRTFVQHVILLETVCRRLPQLAKNLKKFFKSSLDDFIEPIFYALTCECSATETAASVCIGELVQVFGANILKAKVERTNRKFLPLYERELQKIPTT